MKLFAAEGSARNPRIASTALAIVTVVSIGFGLTESAVADREGPVAEGSDDRTPARELAT